MQEHSLQAGSARGYLAVAASCVAGLVVLVAGVTSASGSEGGQAAATPMVKTVEMRANFQKQKLYFKAPKSVHRGDILKIVNKTDPNEIGPHTFSLVREELFPRTKGEHNDCFDKGNVCNEIFQWHRGGKQAVSKAGKGGWDKMGTLNKRGDSWLTQTQDESFKQKVSARPGELTFMCAIHSDMQGSIKVKA